MQRLSITLILLLISVLGIGQQYYFKNWDANDGLLISDINDITQDPMGFIWLATEGGGLVKFDGVYFKSYTTDVGLPSNFISSLSWDADSNLWIGTENGVCVYNGKEFEFLQDNQGYRSERVIGLELIGDEMYVAYRHGLNLFSDSVFSDIESEYFSGQTIYHLNRFKDQLLVSCDSGLVKGSVVKLELPVEKRKTLFSFKSENGFELSDFENYGLVKIDGPNFQMSDTIDDLRINRTAINWNGQGVYNYDGGIIIQNLDGQKKKYGLNNGLKLDRVKSLFEDKNGNLWIGGYSGLSKLVNPYFRNYKLANGLQDERIHSIFSEANNIWFGTNSGVEILRSFNGQNYWFNANSSESDLLNADLPLITSLPNALVFKIIKDRTGRIWFATESGLFSSKDGEIKEWGKVDGLEDNFVFDILETENGSVFIATSSNIFLFEKNHFQKLFDENEQVGASLIRNGMDNSVWFLLLSGDLAKWNDGQWEFMSTSKYLNLNEQRIQSFQVLTSGELIIGTAENGLMIWDGKTLDAINESNGLFSKQVLDIHVHKKNIWLLFPEGVQSISRKEQEWVLGRYLGEADGFLGNESYPNSFYSDHTTDLLWVGTKNGAVAMEMTEIENQSWNYQPSITRVDLFFNSESEWEKREIESWSDVPSSIKLSNDQNYLTFHFTSLESVDPGQLFYRYRLKGNDEEWILAQERRSAIYTGIPHGNYTFEVEAAITPAFSNPKRAELPVIIVPPFYKTFLFWMVLVLLLGGITAWLVRMRINQLNEKIKLETALAESERKALRLQMNPHFIFNALDSISGFIFKNEPKLAVTYLSSFAKLMRLTLESSRKTLVSLHTELTLLKNYLMLEQVRFSNSFEFEIKVEDEIDQYSTLIPPMLIQPNIENAILHGLRAREDAGGKLTIEFSKEENQLNCIITDNGVGREKAKEIKARSNKNHSGVSTDITSERISLLSKSLNREFHFKIIDLYDEEGKAQGTTVVLTLPFIEDDGFAE